MLKNPDFHFFQTKMILFHNSCGKIDIPVGFAERLRFDQAKNQSGSVL
jgi:hypothetical protein